MPLAIPVTTPLISIVATAVLELLQVPPGVASFNAVVKPWQTVVVPVTGESGFTVTVVVAKQPPGFV